MKQSKQPLTNTNGLTFERWLEAAMHGAPPGAPQPAGARAAWARGEDPCEHARSAQTDAADASEVIS